MHRHADGSEEAGAGYVRALRRDLPGGSDGTGAATIAVSGTTATGPDGRALHPGDTHAQALVALERVLAAVAALGGRPEDVVRTRLLLAPEADWRAAARAHGEVFAGAPPANTTCVVAGLVGEGFLVEVEADAVVDGAPGAGRRGPG